ncbi:MAG: tellurite resistance TerB family protein [Halothece sp.]
MIPVTEQLKFTPEEAFVALAIVTVAIDGEHAEEEEMALTQAILSADLFSTYPADKLIMMINNAFAQINQQGTKAILEEAIASLPESLREEVLSAIAKIIMADGKVSSEEKRLLDHLSVAFTIPEEQITKLLEQAQV